MVAAALALAVPAAAQAAPEPADRVLLGGAVYTADRAGITAEAIAIDDGVIAYVGCDRGARRYIGKGTKVTNLRGRMVMPGLHDGHIHGITASADECSLNYEPLTVPGVQRRASRRASTRRAAATALVVSSWYQQFVIPSGTVVTKEVLDALSTTRPIVVTSSDGHTTLVNSRALELAGITAATPDPPNGRIEHAAGRASRTACCRTARRAWSTRCSRRPDGDPVDEARRGLARFAQEGITQLLRPRLRRRGRDRAVRAAAQARRR